MIDLIDFQQTLVNGCASFSFDHFLIVPSVSAIDNFSVQWFSWAIHRVFSFISLYDRLFTWPRVIVTGWIGVVSWFGVFITSSWLWRFTSRFVVFGWFWLVIGASRWLCPFFISTIRLVGSFRFRISCSVLLFSLGVIRILWLVLFPTIE